MKTSTLLITIALLASVLTGCARSQQIEVNAPLTEATQSELRLAAEQSPEVVTGDGASELFRLMADFDLFKDGVAVVRETEGGRDLLFGSRFVCRGPSEQAQEIEDASQYYCEIDSAPIDGLAAVRLFDRLQSLNRANDNLVWDEGAEGSIYLALNRTECSFRLGESPVCTIEDVQSVVR